MFKFLIVYKQKSSTRNTEDICDLAISIILKSLLTQQNKIQNKKRYFSDIICFFFISFFMSILITFWKLNWDTILCKLEKYKNNLFRWFKENHMKANDDKCYLLITIENSVSVNTDGSNVKNKREKKITRHKV